MPEGVPAWRAVVMSAVVGYELTSLGGLIENSPMLKGDHIVEFAVDNKNGAVIILNN